MFYFHPYLGKIPRLTNIFQLGWNHQLDKDSVIKGGMSLSKKKNATTLTMAIHGFWIALSIRKHPGKFWASHFEHPKTTQKREKTHRFFQLTQPFPFETSPVDP